MSHSVSVAAGLVVWEPRANLSLLTRQGASAEAVLNLSTHPETAVMVFSVTSLMLATFYDSNSCWSTCWLIALD